MMVQWILLAVIVAILALVVGVVKYRDRRLIERLRALRCPRCGQGFSDESYRQPQIHARIKVADTGSTTEVGYRLHCSACDKGYFAADDGTVVDEIMEESTGLERI